MLFKCATKVLSKTILIRLQLPRNVIANNRSFHSVVTNSNFNTPSYSSVHAHKQRKRKISFDVISTFIKKIVPKMDAKRLGIFSGEVDRFNGVTVDSLVEYNAKTNFEEKLLKSIDYWQKNNKRAIWFKVRTEHTEWIPVLTKHEFDFHHAGQGYATLRRWLPKDENSNLPDYAHSLVGVGGLVINHDKMEVLVVTDRYAAIPGSWKLPGGYVDPKENLIDAAIREVKEETGIEGTFRTMVSLRHSHGGNFGCSDLYFVIALVAKTLDLQPCEREIARVCWMPIAEYLHNPNVHETNRHTMRTYLEYERRGLRLDCLTATHQILKKEYQIYFTRSIVDTDRIIKVPSEQELDIAGEKAVQEKQL